MYLEREGWFCYLMSLACQVLYIILFHAMFSILITTKTKQVFEIKKQLKATTYSCVSVTDILDWAAMRATLKAVLNTR